MLLKTIFCKACALSFYKRNIIKLIDAIYTDTKSYEIFCGLLCLMWGIGLALPDEQFPPGLIFGKITVINDYIDMTPGRWTLIFLIIGILRTVSSIWGSMEFRKWVSLVSLYFWIIIVCYIYKYIYGSILTLALFTLMSIFSVLTYIGLWKYKYGTS